MHVLHIFEIEKKTKPTNNLPAINGNFWLYVFKTAIISVIQRKDPTLCIALLKKKCSLVNIYKTSPLFLWGQTDTV